MAVNRFVLNGMSFHGHGAINEIPGIVKSKGFKKAFVASDPDLVKFGVTAKVTDLLGDTTLDENRIAQEVTIYADRICVDEEMVRLHSHIDTMEKDLKAGGTIGRKLDFLAQEMNREANTTLSKSTDLTVADNAIFLKTTIEKIREQIQNIE